MNLRIQASSDENLGTHRFYYSLGKGLAPVAVAAIWRNKLAYRKLSVNIVSMKRITKRELARKPSKLTAIRPGESLQVEDREGGLIVTRQKRRRWTSAEIEAQIDRLGKGAPKIDTLAFLQEEES